MNLQELQLAEQGNFYNIIHPSKKTKKRWVDTKQLEESCFDEILKNQQIKNVESKLSDKDADYISKFFLKMEIFMWMV